MKPIHKEFKKAQSKGYCLKTADIAYTLAVNYKLCNNDSLTKLWANRAIDNFKKCDCRKESKIYMMYRIGCAHMLTQEYAEALDWFNKVEKVLDARPSEYIKLDELYENMQISYFKLGNESQGLHYVLKAYKLNAPPPDYSK